MANFKPCPFCGNPIINIIHYDPYDGYQGNCDLVRVFCQTCGGRVEGVDVDAAIAKWNRRSYVGMRCSDMNLASIDIDKLVEEQIKTAFDTYILDKQIVIAGEGRE